MEQEKLLYDQVVASSMRNQMSTSDFKDMSLTFWKSLALIDRKKIKFLASRGWINNFKKRWNLGLRSGDSSPVEEMTDEKKEVARREEIRYLAEAKEIDEQYTPDEQVNYDESPLSICPDSGIKIIHPRAVPLHTPKKKVSKALVTLIAGVSKSGKKMAVEHQCARKNASMFKQIQSFEY